MKHILITRFSYDDENKFNSRLKMMEDTLIPSLKRQTNQNFTWCVLTNNEKHREIIQSKYNKDILFLNVGSKVKDYLIENGFNIQTRQDSDDIICDDYVKIIQDEVSKTNKDILLIQFQPTKLHYKTKREYDMIKYTKKFTSMFLTLYQKNIIHHIHDYKHGNMYNVTDNIITIPKGCVNLVIHDDNMVTKLGSNDKLISKNPIVPELQKQTIKITSIIRTTRKVVR
jgi:hypothetical protein